MLKLDVARALEIHRRKELLKEHGYTISGYTKEEMVSFLESIASSAEDFELLYEKTLSFYAKFLRRT